MILREFKTLTSSSLFVVLPLDEDMTCKLWARSLTLHILIVFPTYRPSPLRSHSPPLNPPIPSLFTVVQISLIAQRYSLCSSISLPSLRIAEQLQKTKWSNVKKRRHRIYGFSRLTSMLKLRQGDLHFTVQIRAFLSAAYIAEEVP
jgi:hypothetical protein